MDSYVIQGGHKLCGSIRIEGAKNAVLPILAASIINDSKIVLHNCPDLRDVTLTLHILKLLGCKIQRNQDKLIIDANRIVTFEIPEDLVKEIRSSIIFLGAMLTRMGKVVIAYPGGCEIGNRPIDFHIKGLKALGVKVNEAGGNLICEAENLKGTEIHLDFPSVGATENLMLAAIGAEGTTVIRNAAREPEIVDLQNFLNTMGCKIMGAGTNVIKIEGIRHFRPVEYTIIPDRIVAGTYLVMAAITASNIEITNIIPEHISSVLFKLRESGCKLKVNKDKIEIFPPKYLKAVETIKTLPYPGFPTDMQAQFMVLMSLARGTSVITENIFENRFKHVGELLKMGAKITIEGRTAVVKGVKKLYGTRVEAKDLRGGVALITAGLVAEGETIVQGAHHIDRGYEYIDKKLQSLGAKIVRSSV